MIILDLPAVWLAAMAGRAWREQDWNLLFVVLTRLAFTLLALAFLRIKWGLL